ncbi:MAG: sigma-70 family RNA polymerase sigma factor [archaeon]
MVQMKKEKIEELNNILINILLNNKENYKLLFKHKYINSTINGVVKKVFNNSVYSFEEIKKEAENILVTELLKEFEVDNEKYLAFSFINYIKKVLYFRLTDFYKQYGVLGKDEEFKINSLERIGIPIEKLKTENFVDYDFEKRIIDNLNFKELLNNFGLSKREKQVIYYLYYCDLTLKEVGNKLGISKDTVYSYQQRALNKYKEKL